MRMLESRINKTYPLRSLPFMNVVVMLIVVGLGLFGDMKTFLVSSTKYPSSYSSPAFLTVPRTRSSSFISSTKATTSTTTSIRGDVFPTSQKKNTNNNIQTLSMASTDHAKSQNNSMEELNLTPQLSTMTQAFASIPDEKTRYKQLLYMANQLTTMDESLKVPENKVPGCLSTVYVDCHRSSSTSEEEEKDGQEVKLDFVGDSDGLLTKGLVALLVRGLSGCTPEEIQKVNPEFIQEAKITQSLTPGRNNGFLNMLAVMKTKAAKFIEDSEVVVDDSDGREEVVENGHDNIITTFDEVSGKPMYNEMMTSLIKLKPKVLSLVDDSASHAGHAGSKGWEESGESHFNLNIIADVFEGMTLVKRHQLIYLVLGDTMQKIHALSIVAKSPQET